MDNRYLYHALDTSAAVYVVERGVGEMDKRRKNEARFVISFTVLLIGIALMTGQNTEAPEYDPDVTFNAHVAELRSMETTLVVTKSGSEGFISTYWVRSGLSSKYTLDEYKAAVVAPSEGVDVDTPVEGDRFIVPWNK